MEGASVIWVKVLQEIRPLEFFEVALYVGYR